MNERNIFSVLLVLSLFFYCLPLAGAAESVGTISAMEGVADVSRSGSDKVLLKERDAIDINDRIRTKSYSKVEITFRDKSVVKLAPNSCITVDEYLMGAGDKRESAKITLSRGRMEAVVSNTGRPETFVINTPNATGSVKGSDIFVSYQAGNTELLVKEGMLGVLSQAMPAEKVRVGKGDCTFVRPGKAPEEARPYYDADIATYKKDVSPTLARKWVSYKGVTQMTAAIVSASGKVLIYKKGAEDWRPAGLNEVVLEGDKVQTAENGYAEIRLGNGNMMILDANTELGFAKLEYNPDTGEYENVFDSDRGNIKAIVEKLGKNSTFRVKTPTALCGVRGTVMYLNITMAATTAFYEGGPGAITSTVTNVTQMVEAGQNSAVDAAGRISTPAYTSTEQKTSLNSSFAEKGEKASLSTPASAGTQVGTTTLTAGTNVGTAAAAGGEPINGDQIFVDNPPFTQTHPPAPVNNVTTLYSTTFNSIVSPTISSISVPTNFLSDNTWAASLSGTFSGNPTGETLTIYSASSDVLYAEVNNWNAGSWSATVSSSSNTQNPPMYFSGSASGSVNDVAGTFSGNGSGTWHSK